MYFSLKFKKVIYREYERAVVFRLGRLIKRGTKGPGIFFIMPCIDTYKIVNLKFVNSISIYYIYKIQVDLRVLSFDVPPQVEITKNYY